MPQNYADIREKLLLRLRNLEFTESTTKKEIKRVEAVLWSISNIADRRRQQNLAAAALLREVRERERDRERENASRDRVREKTPPILTFLADVTRYMCIYSLRTNFTEASSCHRTNSIDYKKSIQSFRRRPKLCCKLTHPLLSYRK